MAFSWLMAVTWRASKLSSMLTSMWVPLPVRSLAKRAAAMPHAVKSPATRSPTDSPALVGGPSGQPLMLIRPEAACTIRS